MNTNPIISAPGKKKRADDYFMCLPQQISALKLKDQLQLGLNIEEVRSDVSALISPMLN